MHTWVHSLTLQRAHVGRALSPSITLPLVPATRSSSWSSHSYARRIRAQVASKLRLAGSPTVNWQKVSSITCFVAERDEDLAVHFDRAGTDSAGANDGKNEGARGQVAISMANTLSAYQELRWVTVQHADR